MTAEPQLDIIIPVYNESANIITSLLALDKGVRTPFRVFICYDLDEDDTLVAIRSPRLAHMNIVAKKNASSGPHGAVVTGFVDSTAPAVVMFPADDDYNADQLDQMYRRFCEGSDVVSASRFMPGGVTRGIPFLKWLIPWVASFTLYHFARLPVHDATNGIRLFSRRVVERIPVESSEGFSYAIELTAKVHRLGWTISEVPARWLGRTHGESRFRLFRWIPAYLRWYFYVYATTFLLRRAETVTLVGSGSCIKAKPRQLAS